MLFFFFFLIHEALIPIGFFFFLLSDSAPPQHCHLPLPLLPSAWPSLYPNVSVHCAWAAHFLIASGFVFPREIE